jgi:hypothetical protein
VLGEEEEAKALLNSVNEILGTYQLSLSGEWEKERLKLQTALYDVA